jgi:hypothetical protein
MRGPLLYIHYGCATAHRRTEWGTTCRLMDQRYKDQRFQDQRFQDQRYKDQRFQDQRFQDQRFQDRRFQDQRSQDQRFQDQRTPYKIGVKYVNGSCILFHNDTYIKFVADAECMNVVPGGKEQCSVHSTEYRVLRALHIYTLHMYTFITRNWQIATLVERKNNALNAPRVFDVDCMNAVPGEREQCSVLCTGYRVLRLHFHVIRLTV